MSTKSYKTFTQADVVLLKLHVHTGAADTTWVFGCFWSGSRGRVNGFPLRSSSATADSCYCPDTSATSGESGRCRLTNCGQAPCGAGIPTQHLLVSDFQLQTFSLAVDPKAYFCILDSLFAQPVYLNVQLVPGLT